MTRPAGLEVTLNKYKEGEISLTDGLESLEETAEALGDGAKLTFGGIIVRCGLGALGI